MELLKVFVGDASGIATSLSTMQPGDLLLLNAADYSIVKSNAVSGITDVVIASCISKNGVNTPVFSTPIKKTNIRYITAANDNENSVSYNSSTLAKTAEASITTTLDGTKLTAGTTYSIGVQIKEDLRMGTYNKNTEIITSHTCPSTAASSLMEVASNFAKGFTANPLSSSGSSSQVVRATRVFSSVATNAVNTAATFTMVPGSRQVTYAAADTLATGCVAGSILNLNDSWYLIDKVDTTNKIVTLDTAYQGTATTATKNATIGVNTAYYVTATNYPTSVSFKFDGVTQSQKNRYDQFRMVDFIVIAPKGYDTGFFTIGDKTGPIYPIGSYRQIRDLEEKAYTNSNPLINYREFPFEVFPTNATSGTYYCMIAVSYVSGWGYNMMQSNQAEFLQTVVVAAPFAADGQFDITQTTADQGAFLESWAAWAPAPNSGSYTFA